MGLQEDFARLPSLGWVRTPSPITRLEALARSLGLASLSVKRDDLLDALHGGNKARKLDVLLATEPFRSAPRWASLGAIGSGHLAACTAAAQALGRQLDAHTFFEPLSAGVLENLAFVASGPTRLTYYGSRLEVALRKRALVLEPTVDGVPMIPPGGTLPAGIAGIARAGLELAEQIRSGALTKPDVVYAALGTGGTVAGLALGLGLAGVQCELRAVATVERIFTSARQVRGLIAQTVAWLAEHGVHADAALAVPVKVVHSQLGAGYGIPSAQSLAAVELLRAEGVPREPVYTGKAFASLLADAAASRVHGHVLFWNTVRRGPLEQSPTWREKLPPRLARRLATSTTTGVGRRTVLVGSAAALGALALRTTGYPQLTGWAGEVFAPWEAHTLAAAAPILSGVATLDGLIVAANVDRYLASAPRGMQAEVHQLMGLIEHGTALGLRFSRFTRLSDDGREAFLLSLSSRGGLLAQAFRGLRDLVMVGTYQHELAWRGLDYAGPWKPTQGPENLKLDYDAFKASPGAAPRGAA